MKLPNLNSTAGRVPSLGRQDITLPVRAAQAKIGLARAEKTLVNTKIKGSQEAANVERTIADVNLSNAQQQADLDLRTARGTIRGQQIQENHRHSAKIERIQYRNQKTQRTLGLVGDVISAGVTLNKYFQQRAVAEASDAVSEYSRSETAIREELFKDAYRQDDDGKLVSNADTLFDNYNASEEELRQSVLDSIEDPDVRSIAESRMEEISIKGRAGASKQAYEWGLADSKAKFETSFGKAIESGDFKLAQDIFVGAADAGLVESKDVPRYQNTINATASIHKFTNDLSNSFTPEQYAEVQNGLNNKEVYGSLNSTQLSALHNEVKVRLEDYWLRHIKSFAAENGIKSAGKELRSLSGKNAHEMGFSSEKEMASVIGSMKTAVNNMKFDLETEKSKAVSAVESGNISAGKPISQTNSKDKKYYNEAFNSTLSKYAAEDGVLPEPFSNEWVSAAVEVSQPHTFLPSQVDLEFARYLSSSDPLQVSKASNFYSALKNGNPILANNLKVSKKDRLFLEQVDAVSGASIPDVSVVNEIRKGIMMLDPVTVENRSKDFSANVVDEVSGILDDQIDNEGGAADPWFEAQATFGAEVKQKFSDLLEHNYSLSGNLEAASKEAYRQLRQDYPLSNRKGRLEIVKPDQPEAIYGDKYGLDWYGEEIDSALIEAGFFTEQGGRGGTQKVPTITSEHVDLYPAGVDSSGNPVWMMYENYTDNPGFITKDGIEVFIGFDYATSKQGKKEAAKIKAREKERRADVSKQKRYTEIYLHNSQTNGSPIFGKSKRTALEFQDNRPDEEKIIDQVDDLLNN